MQKMSAKEFKNQRLQILLTEHYKEKGFEQFDLKQKVALKNGVYYNIAIKHLPFDIESEPEVIQGIKNNEINGMIEVEEVVEYEEQYEHEELTHVDYFDSDICVTFSDVFKLYVYILSAQSVSNLEFTDHVSCNNCDVPSIYIAKGNEECPVCKKIGTLSWFDEKMKSAVNNQ